MQVLSHASLSIKTTEQLSTPLIPWLRLAASWLTLAELCEAWGSLLSGEAVWTARWEGLLSPRAEQEVLRTFLRAHGLKPIAEPRAIHNRCPPRDGSPLPSDKNRCLYEEFLSHSSSCQLGECRAPIPYCPVLASALQELEAVPALSERRKEVGLSGKCQLLFHEDLVSTERNSATPHGRLPFSSSGQPIPLWVHL